MNSIDLPCRRRTADRLDRHVVGLSSASATSRPRAIGVRFAALLRRWRLASVIDITEISAMPSPMQWWMQ
jgi:hypothetical protein